MKKLISDSKQLMSRYDTKTREKMIEMMDDALASIPPDQRDTAEFEIQSYSHDYDPNDYYALFLVFKRLETDIEEKKRETWETRNSKEQEKREQQEYKRLQKKFG